MKSFGEFTHIDQTDLPLLAALPHTGKRLSQLILILNDALVSGQISNSAFTEAKRLLGFVHERMGDAIADKYYNGGLFRNLPAGMYELNLTGGEPGHVAGKLKKLEKIVDHPAKTEYIAYATELMSLVVAMVSLKDKVVKRQPKPPEDRTAKYVAPMMSKDGGAKIIAVLKKLTDEIKTDYIKSVYQMFVETMEKYASLAGTPNDQKTYAKQNSIVGAFQLKVFTMERGQITGFQSGWKETLQKEAESQGDLMQQEFIAKNAMKLGSIVERKGNLVDTKILYARAMGYGIGGRIHVTFADGSSFTVQNSVKWNVSPLGTVFNQYPTTFHDVRLPGGKSMPTPSEERMNSVFAVS